MKSIIPSVIYLTGSFFMEKKVLKLIFAMLAVLAFILER